MKNLEEIKNTKQKFKYVDNDGYLYSLSVGDINDKRTKYHSRFASYNPYSIDNIKHYLELNHIKTKLLSDKYISSRTSSLLWICECGNEFYRSWHHFFGGKYKLCQKCIVAQQTMDKKFTIEQIEDICKTYGFKKLDNHYHDNMTPFAVEDVDGYKGLMPISRIQNNQHFIKFRTQNPYFYDNIRNYFRLNNYNCDIISNKNIVRKGRFEFVCECGNYFNATLDEIINQRKPRLRCKVCTGNFSNGETAVINWLKKNQINFVSQYRFNDCRYKRPLPFDFYLPKYNMCIEFDGAFHYRRQEHITEESFRLQQLRDEIKNNYCKEHDIKILRIPYWFLYNNKYKEILKQNILV